MGTHNVIFKIEIKMEPASLALYRAAHKTEIRISVCDPQRSIRIDKIMWIDMKRVIVV